MLLAKIEKAENQYIARFERHLKHSVHEVWSYLTENEKLAMWFPELSVDELREGGIIKFDMRNGTFLEMTITELKMQAVLEYTWGETIVRFELGEESSGCQLVLVEKISKITDHTPRDLAGWHVCLDVVEALLARTTIESRREEWNKWYEKYVEAVNKVVN